MADSVLFASASSEIIECNKGTLSGTGAITLAAVVKFTTFAGDSGMCSTHSGAFNLGYSVDTDSSGNVTLNTDTGGAFDSGDAIATGAWVIVAISKTSGTTTPRVHIYRDPTWRHADMGSTVANVGSTTGFCIGAIDPGEGFLNGNVLIAAAWDSALSDGAVAALSGGYQAWIDAAPAEGIRVNALTGLTTFTAGSMSETGHTGGTVDTGDIPSWWNDATGGGPFDLTLASETDTAQALDYGFPPIQNEPEVLRIVRSGTVYR